MSEDYIRNNFDAIRDKASVIEHRIDDELDLERLIKCSEAFRHDCAASGTPYLDITDKYDADALAERIIKEAGSC